LKFKIIEQSWILIWSYNFVVERFFIWSCLVSHNLILIFKIYKLIKIFGTQNSLNFKTSQLQSCRSHWWLQFWYKVYIYSSSYEKIINYFLYIVFRFALFWPRWDSKTSLETRITQLKKFKYLHVDSNFRTKMTHSNKFR